MSLVVAVVYKIAEEPPITNQEYFNNTVEVDVTPSKVSFRNTYIAFTFKENGTYTLRFNGDCGVSDFTANIDNAPWTVVKSSRHFSNVEISITKGNQTETHTFC